MATASKRAPKTYGELRKLLAEAGDPWQPDPTRSDDEPLPEFPTGGDGVYEPASRILGKGHVYEALKSATPPSNPDLRAEWRKEALLPDVDRVIDGTRPKRSSRKKAPTTPAPDSGG